MTDKEQVIEGLKELSGFLFKEYGKVQAEEANLYYDRFLTVDNAITLLKEQEAEWIYGEEETGVDGYRCSECNFFEPWFYEFDGDIDFIKRYEHCPKCGRKMISYTGK